MTSVWAELFDEIARWHDAGRTVDFWWRDDDACHADPALDRLVELSAGAQVPLALAVVAHQVEASVLAPDARWVRILQHGTDHVRRNGAGEKKVIWTPEKEELEIFNLTRDPFENKALTPEEGEKAYDGETDQLTKWFKATHLNNGENRMDEKDQEALKSLGYIQ